LTLSLEETAGWFSDVDADRQVREGLAVVGEVVAELRRCGPSAGGAGRSSVRVPVLPGRAASSRERDSHAARSLDVGLPAIAEFFAAEDPGGVLASHLVELEARRDQLDRMIGRVTYLLQTKGFAMDAGIAVQGRA